MINPQVLTIARIRFAATVVTQLVTQKPGRAFTGYLRTCSLRGHFGISDDVAASAHDLGAHIHERPLACGHEHCRRHSVRHSQVRRHRHRQY